MVVSAFRVMSAMGRLGPGVACVGSRGSPSDGVWKGVPQEGGRSYCQVFDEVECCGVVVIRRGQEVGVRVPGYGAELYAPPIGRGRQGLLQGARARLLQWVHWAVMGCGNAYMVKGPTARCTWWRMMVRKSANHAVGLSSWSTQSVSSSAILRRSFRASMVLLWMASVIMPGPVLMRGSRLFWCCAAARLRAA